MKLVTFSTADGIKRPGSLIEEAGLVVDLTTAGYADAAAVIAAGYTSVLNAETAARKEVYAGYKLNEIRLHAPIANPPRVFAIGLNYHDHAIEAKMALPKFPVVFFKMTTAIVGPEENIVLPKNSTQPDYEAEFAFVIGNGGYRIPASDVARACLWIHHCERCKRARCADVYVAVVAGQELSQLLSDGPGHRDDR